MRLAVLSPYTDPIRGGITSYTRELLNGYRRLGIETLGLAWEGIANPGFDVLGGNKIEFVVKSTMRMVGWKPDVAHGHSHWHVLLPCLLLKTIRPKTRVLFTFHTPPESGDEGLGMLGRMKRAVFRAMVCLCDGVTFVSEETKNAMALPSLVRQGIVYAAPERFADTGLPWQKDAEREPIILTISMLIWPKKVSGLILLLHAFSSIAASFPEWRLVIVGDGPLREQVQEEVLRLGIEEKVVIKGFVEDIHSELTSAAVFTHISLHEGLPIALLDAMSVGLPVVATSVGGIPKVVQNRITGYVVECKEEAIAGALAELLQDPSLRRRMGDAAKAWTAAELSWEKVASKDLEFAGVTRPETALRFH